MIDLSEELVFEAIVRGNHSNEMGYDYDLRMVNINEGDPGDIPMRTTSHYHGRYGLYLKLDSRNLYI